MKSGVSLITVLMFMLIATIAATATYKLLTSQGRSSVSRMRQQEAYQSSQAGIESARMWMTFHANDVGALIKAFIDGGNKPINLDARLRPLQRAGQNYHVWLTGVNTEKTTFKLKILSSGESGDNTQWNEAAIFNVDGLYRVRLFEEEEYSAIPFRYNYFGGTTRTEGHSKAFSLLVNGDLNGSNPVYTDDDLIITGNANITGSSLGAGTTACIGGNLNANNGVLGNDFYVGGNASSFTFPTSSEAAKLYNANVTGNVYIEGNLEAPTTGDQKFQRNLTLNGTWYTNFSAHDSRVAGNMCLGEHGQVLISEKNPARDFLVGGNLWAESTYPIWIRNGEDNEGEYNKIILGNKKDSKVYIKSAHPIADYVTLRNNRTFIEKNTYYKGSYTYGSQAKWDNKTTRPYPDLKPHMKNKNDAYYLYYYNGKGQDVDYIVSNANGWGWGAQAYYANYYVGNNVFYTPQIGYWGSYGYTAEKNNFLNYQNGTPTGSPYCKATPDKWRPECRVTPWFKSQGTVSSEMPASQPFECAESVKTYCNKLWKKKEGCDGASYKVDDILVTAYNQFISYAHNNSCSKVTHWGDNMSRYLNECYKENSSDPTKYKNNLYNGYQVVEIKHRPELKNPTTPLKGKFIIVVDDDLGQQNLPPTTADSYVLLYLKEGASSTIQPAVENGIYNYFIYTKKNINGLLFNNSTFSGSVYATADNCAKVGDFKARSLVFNEDMMNDLSANAVICNASVGGSSCGGAATGTSGSSSSSSESTEKLFDSYYISMAPQLGVRLETQNKSSETPPQASSTNITELSPSFIVLPRIIYLPNDPYGQLSDYYNIQTLNGNGTALRKSDVNVSCSGPGALSTTGNLYLGTALSRGLYTCTATANGYPSIPFWVHVGKDTRGTTTITFEKESEEMDADDLKEVKLVVPAHAAELTVNFYCPDVENEAWSYVSLGENVTRNGMSCNLKLAANSSAATPTIATIKTSNAVKGTLLFQLLPGEGYIPGSPSSTELYIASSAQLNREEATSTDIKEYCDNHSGNCPSNYETYWPDCDVSGVWVEPSGTSFINLVDNSTWVITVGNTQSVTLAATGSNDCETIIPQTNNSIAANAVQANKNYTLRASAKAKKRTFTVGFKGNVGSSKSPIINLYIDSNYGSRNEQCRYEDARNNDETSTKTCTFSIFKGESVKAALEDNDDANEFSYWKCSGGSCPTTDGTNTSKEFDSFTLSDDNTELIAYFGENDKHCFFDEFKRNSVECGDDVQYCIDKCSDNDIYSTCTGAVDGNSLYPNSKWHLISGYLSQIVVGSSGEIHIDKSAVKKKKQSARNPVMVLSTVNAGILGTLKALINVPRVTTSYDNTSTNIKNSGFMLRANTYGNDYFMLNLYENSSGALEAQLWKGTTSLTSTLTNSNGYKAYVSTSKMVMATITITNSGTIEVRANIGDFYGDSSTEYECSFKLSEFNNPLADAAHEYVGFSLGDPNFKIYGIGWKSATYNSECYDTYPTVKCSFAAVATDGVIKTDTLVKPWVGHSGWFDSKGCTPLYYYYNGNDASTTCSGESCYDGYKFDKSGIGAHGYTEAGTEYKTAKAWLGNCTNVDETAMAWGVSASAERAHCGAFWTGEFKECLAHQDLFSGSKSIGSLEETIVFENKQNLRAATLHITLENTDNNEVEIWLVSESDNWGEYDHESHSVSMSGTTGSFNIMQEFATGSNGFDPENVKQIVLKNHGSTSVTVTSITSTCANAIGITYCRAEYDGDNWNVTTQVTNKSLISKQQITATVDGSTRINQTKDAVGSDGIVWNGDMATLSIPDAYVYSYQGKSYVFNATITGTSGQTFSKQCSVSPDPIGRIGVDCSVISAVASGARFPTFNVNFSGCPGNGCGYEIYLDNGYTPFATGTEKTAARHSANQNESCNTTEGCEHTYTVKSTANPALFDDCSASFKVQRNADDIPPTVTCGISTNPNGFTSDPVSVSDNLYFLARNNESVEKQYAVTLKRGDAQLGSATLSNWSGLTNIKDLGKLAAGDYTYSLYYKNEKICDANITVNEESGACHISGSLYEGQIIEMNVSGVTANTQFTWTLNGNSQTIDCGTSNCWNNRRNAPTTSGTYSYSVTKGSHTLCTGNVTIEPILSCSVNPTTVGKGESYTFTANAAANCWNCSFVNDAGNTEYNLQNQAVTSLTLTRTASNSTGNKTLSLSCTCQNNINATCSTPLKVEKAKPSFSCANNLKATAGANNNVKVVLTGIAGCDENDCDYLISGTGADGTWKDCSDASCVLPTITNTSTTSGNSESYHVTLRNSVGESETKDCSVEFVAGATCLAVTWEPKSGTTPNNTGDNNWSSSFPWTAECFDITTTGYTCSGNFNIKAENCKGETLVWNNSTVTLQSSDGYYYGSNPDPGSTIHISATKSCTITQLYLDGCTEGASERGSENNPIDVGSTQQKLTYEANKWYAITMHQYGHYVVQNYTGNEATMTYKDCYGATKTKAVRPNQSGDAGGGWWNSIENPVWQSCKIRFKFSISGEFDMTIW